jgi:hypothetical protein
MRGGPRPVAGDVEVALDAGGGYLRRTGSASNAALPWYATSWTLVGQPAMALAQRAARGRRAHSTPPPRLPRLRPASRAHGDESGVRQDATPRPSRMGACGGGRSVCEGQERLPNRGSAELSGVAERVALGLVLPLDAPPCAFPNRRLIRRLSREKAA